MNILEYLMNVGIAPILPYFKKQDVIMAAEAALEGGIPIIEILLRDPEAENAIKEAVKNVPEVKIGAGTVLNAEQCKKAVDLGASFIVSPGFDEETVTYCLKHDIPIIPGAITPTEIQKAFNFGLKVVKYFPILQMGGADMLNVIGGPFPSIQYVVTGDVGYQHLKNLAMCKKVAACGGVWMFCEDDGSPKAYHAIVETLEESIQLVKEARMKG